MNAGLAKASKHNCAEGSQVEQAFLHDSAELAKTPLQLRTARGCACAQQVRGMTSDDQKNVAFGQAIALQVLLLHLLRAHSGRFASVAAIRSIDIDPKNGFPLLSTKSTDLNASTLANSAMNLVLTKGVQKRSIRASNPIPYSFKKSALDHGCSHRELLNFCRSNSINQCSG